ncbi:MAG: immunity 8 family protein [Bacteroidota bacterium]
MQAEIKYLHSPDIFDLEKFSPETPDCFGFLLQIMAGPVNNPGCESFDITVCTPLWLIQNNKPADILFCQHYLIVFEYSFANIQQKLNKYISVLNGNTWKDLALQIGRIGKWEFEDYVE